MQFIKIFLTNYLQHLQIVVITNNPQGQHDQQNFWQSHCGFLHCGCQHCGFLQLQKSLLGKFLLFEQHPRPNLSKLLHFKPVPETF